MKQIFFAFIFLLSVSFIGTIKAQQFNQAQVDSLFRDRGEIYFKCRIQDKEMIHTLTRIISIDNVKGNELFAYANKKEFSEFLRYKLTITILPDPGSLLKESELNPFGSGSHLKNGETIWNFYPTYDDYVNYMAGFATAYPAISKLDTIGYSVQGRMILVLKISNSINQDEAEPQFLYTSSIHGDETTGYILLLHLIDYLLSNYGIDPVITNLVNTTQIFINPLANPDGTYHGGNSSVNGAMRYNANFIDLNRNFPDPIVGPHPDGNAWQPETQAWMNYAGICHFTMSANFHGGSEVFNYPWDTWAKLNADDNWWQFVGREWADTSQYYGPSGYFNQQNNGITNGYAWYEVNGGRQDYMNYWHHCKEVTVELSDIKLMPAAQLLDYWNYNYHTFLNYIWESHYGFSGITTDTVTGQPIAAKVFIAGHDFDSTEVHSRLPSGFYIRPIYEGTYDVTFSSPGYFTKTISNVTILNRNTTNLNVQLRPLTYDVGEKAVVTRLVYPNPSDGHFSLIFPETLNNPSCSIQVINSIGSVVYSANVCQSRGKTTAPVDIQNLPEGLYFLKFNSGSSIYIDKLHIIK